MWLYQQRLHRGNGSIVSKTNCKMSNAEHINDITMAIRTHDAAGSGDSCSDVMRMP